MRKTAINSCFIGHTDLAQIELVANFCGLRLHKVPRVADIEHEV